MSPDVWVIHGTGTSTEFGETFRQSGVNSCLDESYSSKVTAASVMY